MRRPAKRRSSSGPRRGGAPKRARRRRGGTRWARWVLYGLGAAAIAGAAALAWLVWPSWRAAEELSSRDRTRPSLVYGRPERVARGERLAAEDLVARLRALGYRRSSQSPIPTGGYRAGDDRVDVALRSFPTAEGPSAERQLRVRFDGKRIESLSLAGDEVASATLDPPLLGLLVGDDLRDRRPLRRAELPEHVVQAVLAAEDATFFEHRGISLQSVLRATWVNLKSGEVQQGGSTLTQQLVKNLYLTPERTLLRKIREGVLSLLVELRFDKEAILEAYLNEAYWGRARGVSLMGMGAAARAWFGCDARELDIGRGGAPRRHAALSRQPRSGAPPRGEPRAPRRGAGAHAGAGLARRRSSARRRRRGARALLAALRAAHARLLPRRDGARGPPPLRARRAAVARLHAAHDARPRGPVGGREGARRRARARRGDRSGSGAPGRSALARSSVGRHPGLGGRSQLPGQPVRPGRARAAPAGQRVQAGDLHRRVRRRRRDAVDAARRRPAHAPGRWRDVAAAERRSPVPRLGHRAARARRQHQRGHDPPRRAHRLEAGGRDRARARHRRAAPGGAVAGAGLDRSGAAAPRRRLRHARERRLAHRAAPPARRPRRFRRAARRQRARATAAGDLSRGGVPGVLPAAGRARLRHRGLGAVDGSDRRAGGQDRHHQRGARQLVRRLLAGTGHAGLGRLRRQPGHSPVRQPRGAADLVAVRARPPSRRRLSADRGAVEHPVHRGRSRDRRLRRSPLPERDGRGLPRGHATRDRLLPARGRAQATRRGRRGRGLAGEKATLVAPCRARAARGGEAAAAAQ